MASWNHSSKGTELPEEMQRPSWHYRFSPEAAVPSSSANGWAICLLPLNSALLEAAQMPQLGLQSQED